MELKDEDIKKASSCCVKGDCVSCPLYYIHNCRTALREGMNNILNKQQIELVLKKDTINDLNNKLTEKQSENEKLQSLCASKDVIIKEQQAEIEKLKWEKDHFEFKVDDLNGKLEKFKEYRDIKNGAYEREIEKLRAENERLNGNLFTISNACMQRRNEAIKEFAERLKAKVDPNWDNSVDVEDIDRLVAEMVGGENA